ncbi:hypothetical protein EZL74_10045 [Flavobacterium silvisoli]|uniref:Uncharacterized protein n=1 Tax=Flavobacterium silvisoli TaxID=2529433 RepID=A0A4Q9YTP0_9FLAO|nr:hypothetical protein [Flavobacterium silvisoli]TBX66992.1 hypothetical protein EZL74_10045 [Flavobacterium silvisoli]
MEQHNWIEKVLNSTNGMKAVEPGDDLLYKIRQKINRPDTVSPTTVWLVAASVAVLVILNITVMLSETETKTENSATSAYLETTINQSNQLYR